MIAILVVLLFIAGGQSQRKLDSFKSSIEQKTSRIAAQFASLYQQRCEEKISSCQIKSYIQCEGTAEKQCIQDFPTPSGCNSTGAYLTQTSTVSFPEDKNIDFLDQQSKLFVCSSAFLDSTFQQIGENREESFTFAYVGSPTGGFRVHPSFRYTQDNKCSYFDPRFRPWYVSATTGSKNIVLVIDVSGSMDGVKLNKAKEAFEVVINSLSINDFVGVVEFSTNARSLLQGRLNRATTVIKNKIISEIQSISAGGSTNYEAAFNNVFRILNQSEADEYGSPCINTESVIIFLTDGRPSSNQNSHYYIQIIKSLKGDRQIRLFTYGFGSQSEINVGLLLDLSCEFKGINFLIKGGDELIDKIKNYYQYISTGVTIDQPVWSQAYDDAFNFGRIITATLPIYEQDSSSKFRKLLGVIGIDVQIDYLLKEYKFENQKEVMKQLFEVQQCHKSKLQFCDLENLRGQFKCYNENITCSQQNTLVNCQRAITSESKDQNLCCEKIYEDEDKDQGISPGALAGIIIGSICFGLLIGAIIFCICRKKSKEKLKRQRQIIANKKQPLPTERQLRQKDEKNNKYQYMFPNPYQK